MISLCFGLGCATPRTLDHSFDLSRDSLALTNELVWTYEFGANGSVRMREAESPPKFALRCFPMTRVTREFFYHADFAPEEPKVSTDEYRDLVRKVVKRTSRQPSTGESRIIIPGYPNLRELSDGEPEVVRQAVGRPVRSYLQRGNWRMIFPVTRERHRKTALALLAELEQGRVPIVHVYQFPNTTLNHALLIYSARETEGQVEFLAYDPNDPRRPAELRFDRGTRTFLFERNRYFGGGPVRVYEVYRGWCY